MVSGFFDREVAARGWEEIVSQIFGEGVSLNRHWLDPKPQKTEPTPKKKILGIF